MKEPSEAFWALPSAELLQRLETTSQGLATDSARQRLALAGAPLPTGGRRTGELTLLLSQFKSPLIPILLFAAGLSLVLNDSPDAVIILVIARASGLLGFWQERGAAHAVEALLAVVQPKAAAVRDGVEQDVRVVDLVPGDAVVLSAGKNIPGDCLLLESKDLFLDEATLTGETYPVAKSPGTVPADAALGQRSNTLFR